VCHSARWDPAPSQPLVYVYRTSYALKSFTEQVGPSPTYVIKPSDRGELQCFVVAVNAGGVGLDVTSGIDLGF
jgi:hypothetical protein